MRSKTPPNTSAKKRLIIACCCLAVAIPARQSLAESPEPVSAESVAAAQAETEFTLDLYRNLANASGDNVIMSGYSVTSAFLILAEGTSGEAASQIGSVFHLPDWAASSDENQPWNFSDFSRACVALQRSMEPIGPDQSAALQERLDELNQQWVQLNSEVENASGPRQLRLRRQLQDLSDEIATVSQQIDPYALRFANALWSESQFPFRPEYLSNVTYIWGAAAFSCNFSGHPEEERIRINNWVAGQTEDRIQDLLTPGLITEETRLVITNAVYFKGKWETEFNPNLTEDQPFYVIGGEELVVPLMSDPQRDCHYVELTPEGDANEFQRTDEGWVLPENPNGFKVLELPYRGGKLSMVLVLPNCRDGLGELEDQLNAETLAGWNSRLQQQEVDVFVPRFTVTREYILNDPLKELGITEVFEPGGVDALSSHSLQVTVVKQKAFIEVNEEGTEAAAATAIVVGEGAPVPRPTPEFRADHPFLYYIQDRDTGAILFMGRLSAPETAE